MHATARATVKAASWSGSKRPTSAKPRWGLSLFPRQEAGGTTSFRAIVTSSAFIIVFAVGLLVGGRAAIDPLFRAAIEAREARRGGDVVYPLGDGKMCRHMSFNNSTAEITQGEVIPCPESMTNGVFHSNRGFSWGGSDR